MTGPVLVFIKTVAWLSVGIAGTLATVSGCVAAITWLHAAVGSGALISAAAFMCGCVLTHAVDRARDTGPRRAGD